MRVNIYAEEMTDKVELIEKETKDGKFVGVRFWLELPVTKNVDRPDFHGVTQIKGPFMHHPDDNDSAAVTFWGKAQLKVALRKALDLLEKHDKSTLEYCRVHIDPNGNATMIYKWNDSDVEGIDTYDECVTGWTDDEVARLTADLVGIHYTDVDKIEVIWG